MVCFTAPPVAFGCRSFTAGRRAGAKTRDGGGVKVVRGRGSDFMLVPTRATSQRQARADMRGYTPYQSALIILESAILLVLQTRKP